MFKLVVLFHGDPLLVSVIQVCLPGDPLPYLSFHDPDPAHGLNHRALPAPSQRALKAPYALSLPKRAKETSRIITFFNAGSDPIGFSHVKCRILIKSGRISKAPAVLF
jgi:hypothetical protein